MEKRRETRGGSNMVWSGEDVERGTLKSGQ